MQLTLLQTRLAASLAASIVVFILYLLLISPNGALAADIQDVLPIDKTLEYASELQFEETYEPEFAHFGRSIIGRAPRDIIPLKNNKFEALNVDPGSTACYSLAKEDVLGGNEARNVAYKDEKNRDGISIENSSETRDIGKRQEPKMKTIYISVNTCLQPNSVESDGQGERVSTTEPPQLRLVVTNSTARGCPDLSKQDSSAYFLKELEGGAATYSMNFTDDIYIGISAPNSTEGFSGIYNFELAVSTEDYFHRFESKEGERELLWLDSDYSSALLLSKNLTTNSTQASKIMDQGLPYEIYLDNEEFPRLHGLRHSRCGLEKNSQIAAYTNEGGHLSEVVHMKMTTRGPGGFPKQQFYITSLNSTTTYRGILVKPGGTESNGKSEDGVVGGGGTVFESTSFETLSGTTCQIVTELDFCDQTQYAIPGNTAKFKDDELGQTYDGYAKKMYENFEKALMQIPCEAPATQRYSLTKTCDDCRAAYKRWLCTVVMPRCEDYLSNNTHTILRNIGQDFPNGTSLSDELKNKYGGEPASNSSRNKFIDETIQPGPYKEILPCDDLCYEVVQSCPAQLEFACPLPGFHGFDGSYGRRNPDFPGVACNYPGEFRTKISAGIISSPDPRLLGAATLLAAMLILGGDVI